MNRPVLEAKGLGFAYPGKEFLFQDVSFRAEAGESVAIVGRSGCGKSTLAHCLASIIPRFRSGTLKGLVQLVGRNICELPLPEASLDLGIVFQNPDTQLFFSTVEDEIAFGPENIGLPPSEIRDRVDRTLVALGIDDLRMSHPHQLSGGQKQLVALGAVLSLEPRILIFDEAVSQVDRTGKELVSRAMGAMKAAGKTLLIIDHDFDNLGLCDRILVLREGRLEAYDGIL